MKVHIVFNIYIYVKFITCVNGVTTTCWVPGSGCLGQIPAFLGTKVEPCSPRMVKVDDSHKEIGNVEHETQHENKNQYQCFASFAVFSMCLMVGNGVSVLRMRLRKAIFSRQDVALWLVPALMQTLNFLGPDISTGAWGEGIAEMSHLIPLSSVRVEKSFGSIMAATAYMMKAFPATGQHVLGSIFLLTQLTHIGTSCVPSPTTRTILQFVMSSMISIHYLKEACLFSSMVSVGPNG